MSDARREVALHAAWHVLAEAPFDNATRDVLARAISDAVEAALDHRDPPTDPIARGRWSCGCDSAQCRIRSDVWTQGTPSTSLTCVIHGLVGRGDNSFDAMAKLDALHAEQCR